MRYHRQRSHCSHDDVRESEQFVDALRRRDVIEWRTHCDTGTQSHLLKEAVYDAFLVTFFFRKNFTRFSRWSAKFSCWDANCNSAKPPSPNSTATKMSWQPNKSTAALWNQSICTEKTDKFQSFSNRTKPPPTSSGETTAHKTVAVSSKFENVSLEGGARATQLVRRYGNLYSEARLDALDALDSLDEVSQFDDLKVKILYSVLVVRFTHEFSIKWCVIITT